MTGRSCSSTATRTTSASTSRCCRPRPASGSSTSRGWRRSAVPTPTGCASRSTRRRRRSSPSSRRSSTRTWTARPRERHAVAQGRSCGHGGGHPVGPGRGRSRPGPTRSHAILVPVPASPSPPPTALPPPTPARALPRALRAGDRVALVAPAGPVWSEGIAAAVDRGARLLRGLGLEPVEMPHVRSTWGFCAGTDDERLTDLHAAWADAGVAGIWCVRGGYGCTRIADRLALDLVAANPKVLVGYSDVTALHLAVGGRTGQVTFHGPCAQWDEARLGGPGDAAARSLAAAVMRPEPVGTLPARGRTLVPGTGGRAGRRRQPHAGGVEPRHARRGRRDRCAAAGGGRRRAPLRGGPDADAARPRRRLDPRGGAGPRRVHPLRRGPARGGRRTRSTQSSRSTPPARASPRSLACRSATGPGSSPCRWACRRSLDATEGTLTVTGAATRP